MLIIPTTAKTQNLNHFVFLGPSLSIIVLIATQLCPIRSVILSPDLPNQYLKIKSIKKQYFSSQWLCLYERAPSAGWNQCGYDFAEHRLNPAERNNNQICSVFNLLLDCICGLTLHHYDSNNKLNML